MRYRQIVISALFLVMIAAACSSEPTSDDPSPSSVSSSSSTSAVEASASSAIDRPLPTVDQLDGAGDCDTLNMLMTGVLAEQFRYTADVTMEEYNDVGTYDDEATALVADHYQAFSNTSARLGCSPAESAAVFTSAAVELCQEWGAMGHDPDEDPLFANTAFCLGTE